MQIKNGSDLRALRQHKNVSQQILADRIGTTQAEISRIESNQTDPSLSTVIRYLRGLDLIVEVREDE